MKKRHDFHNFIEFVIVLRPNRCNTGPGQAAALLAGPCQPRFVSRVQYRQMDLGSAIVNLMWEASLSIGARPTVWRDGVLHELG